MAALLGREWFAEPGAAAITISKFTLPRWRRLATR